MNEFKIGSPMQPYFLLNFFFCLSPYNLETQVKTQHTLKFIAVRATCSALKKSTVT